MPYPTELPIVDLMFSIPNADMKNKWYGHYQEKLKDQESLSNFEMPAQYMFKDLPKIGGQEDYVAFTLAQMDHFNIDKVLLTIDGPCEDAERAVTEHGDRFSPSIEVDPNNGMSEVRRIKEKHEKYGVKAVGAFPSGLLPQVPLNDKRFYPIYAACAELNIPIMINAGISGPRLTSVNCQHVELFDEVCWFFPDLKIVMRHGAEPWEALAVKLMIKYPNLYYMTSAFAPKYYPKAIIDYANTRGGDKIMYAGYYPMGLSLERIFSEMDKVPFREHVWPKFLHENARRVFDL